MAVVLRFSRRGLHNYPFYRLVAADKVRSRDGKHLEVLGTYSPKASSKVTLNEERVKHWLNVGATYSETVRSILKKNLPGVIEARETNKTNKIRAARKARKARAAKRGDAGKTKTKKAKK